MGFPIRQRPQWRCSRARMPDDGIRSVDLQAVLPDGKIANKSRPLAIEAPIAIEYNGLGYAVMMATPIDLHDLAIGLDCLDC